MLFGESGDFKLRLGGLGAKGLKRGLLLLEPPPRLHCFALGLLECPPGLGPLALNAASSRVQFLNLTPQGQVNPG